MINSTTHIQRTTKIKLVDIQSSEYTVTIMTKILKSNLMIMQEYQNEKILANSYKIWPEKTFVLKNVIKSIPWI